jgi:hypothetical protein
VAFLIACAVVAALVIPVVVGQEAPPPAATAAPAPTPPPSGPGERGIQAPSLDHLMTAPEGVEADPLHDLESLTPPDGKWLQGEYGREYFVTRLKKVPGKIQRLDEETIAYVGLYRWRFDREDEEYYYVRVCPRSTA